MESADATPPPGLAGLTPLPGLAAEYTTGNGNGKPCADCGPTEANSQANMTLACVMLAGAVLLLAIAVARKGAVPNGG